MGLSTRQNKRLSKECKRKKERSQMGSIIEGNETQNSREAQAHWEERRMCTMRKMRRITKNK